MDRLRAWLPLAPLLVLLAGTYWLSQQVAPLPPPPDYKARHDPDVIVNNFSAVTLDQRGAPRFQVSAQKLVHYPDTDSTYLDAPFVTATHPAQPPVHISAANGEISQNGDEIFMRDAVKIVREASANQSELVATTSYLHVLPDLEQADTDQPIAVTDARSVTNAVGMQFDNKTRELKLLAKVRGQYEPARR